MSVEMITGLIISTDTAGPPAQVASNTETTRRAGRAHLYELADRTCFGWLTAFVRLAGRICTGSL